MTPIALDLPGLLDLALPRLCVGCGQAGPSICPSCLHDLAGECFVGGPQPVRPDPCPDGLGLTWACGVYAGVLAAALRAYKDQGRHDLRPVLGVLLEAGVRAAVEPRNDDPPLLVNVPSSRQTTRRRGARPVAVLAAGAARSTGLVHREALVVGRRVRDAAGLGYTDRARNIAHALRARPTLVGGRSVVLIDDILTTGATMSEAQRAVELAGAVVVARVVVAAAARTHRGDPCHFPGN